MAIAVGVSTSKNPSTYYDHYVYYTHNKLITMYFDVVNCGI